MKNQPYWMRDILENSDIIEFFIKFSRFEYALKKNGYYQATNNIITKTNFNQFSKKYKGTTLNSELLKFLKYLDENPVGKLKTDGSYDKTKDSAKSELQRLVNYVIRIRNNLFHGVKYSNLLGQENKKRNEKLIKGGIIVIDFLVTLEEKVNETYKG